MKRIFRFIGLLVKLKLQQMMTFRLSFFGVVFADGALFLMQILAFQAIYGRVDSIGGWSRGEMLIFIGTFSMINGLNLMICFFGVQGIPGKIRDGSLDHYITKPMNALFRLTFESADPGSAPLILLSGAIIIYGANVAGVSLAFPRMLMYGILVLMMSVLWYDMELILRTLSFFFVEANAIDPIERLEGSLLALNFRVPGIAYKGVFKVLFYFVLPYGIMATVPTQALSDTLSPPALIHAFCVVIFFTWFALWFWKLGLKHYKSASS